MSSLQIDGITKRFGRIEALNDVTLSVADGEFVIMLGPTGAGKTTTLRCVAGLEKLDQGSVSMDGQPVDDLSPAERDVALVFQSYALYPRKSVYQNMAFPLEARAMSRQGMDDRIREVATKLDIHELLNRRPSELSGGQMQRVALGRAMVREPRLFLMDEPLTNLDFKLRAEMRVELKRLQKELAATFFYVTNDQVEAMSMADRIAVLHEGVVQQVDTPEAIYDHPTNLFVAGFVGSPQMNLLACAYDAGERVLVGDGGTWRIRPNTQQNEKLNARHTSNALTLGIRPEDVDLLSGDVAATGVGEVYIIEPLGDRIIVDIHIGDDMVKVKVPPSYSVAAGDALALQFDANRFHIFDNTTGEAIF